MDCIKSDKYAALRKYSEHPKSLARDLANGENEETTTWLILHPEKVEFSQEVFMGLVGFFRIQSRFKAEEEAGRCKNFILEMFRAYLWAQWDLSFLIDQFYNTNQGTIKDYMVQFGQALNTIITTKDKTYTRVGYDFCLEQLPLDQNKWVTEALKAAANNKQ